MSDDIEIISFYEFRPMNGLDEIKLALKAAMREYVVRGTIILAEEGFNGMICGTSAAIADFLAAFEKVLDGRIVVKSSFHTAAPFRKIDVKIKPEIVTLKREVDMSLAAGTHVDAKEWNELIADPATLVLDARNDYEYRTGTFRGAVNPQTRKFSELPDFVAENLDPERHQRVAMFCTGGIRCEKFAPYLKQVGFREVYQLEGGILKYLEKVAADESLWEGECFVFDERVTVDHDLKKGGQPDHSQRRANSKKHHE